MCAGSGFGKSNRNFEIRASETPQDRIGNADHFPAPIQERSAGTAGSGLRVKRILSFRMPPMCPCVTTG